MHRGLTATAGLQLRAEHKLSSPLLRLQGKCSTFLHCHFYGFSLCSLLVLDVTLTGNIFWYLTDKNLNAIEQTTSFSGVPLLSLGALLPKSVTVDA